MPALTLTPAQRKGRRADAHHLNPIVQIGADGATAAVIREIDSALKAHGLIKVRVFSDDRPVREAILTSLADELGAAPVQHIGKLLVLWRPVPPKEKVDDSDRKPGPRVVKLVSFSKSGNHRATVKKVKLFGNQRVAAGGQIKRVKPRLSSVKKKSPD